MSTIVGTNGAAEQKPAEEVKAEEALQPAEAQAEAEAEETEGE